MAKVEIHLRRPVASESADSIVTVDELHVEDAIAVADQLGFDVVEITEKVSE